MVLMDGEIVEIGGAHLDAGGLRPARPRHRLRRPVRHRHRSDGAHPARGRRRAADADRLRFAAKPPASAWPRIIAAGIIPVAIEFMDSPAIEVCEAFAKAGYPLDVEALLIIEVEGSRGRDRRRCSRCIARSPRRSSRSDHRRQRRCPEQSAKIWKGRKSAFGAIGRISDYYCMDGTIPLGAAAATCCGGSPRSARATASRSPTSSTPATATCIRSILYDANDPEEGRQGGSGRRRNPEAVRRGRRLPDRRARRRHREARPDARRSSPPTISRCRCGSRPCSIRTGC